MDFGLTAEEESFRQEVRDFLNRELPSDWMGFVEVETDEQWEFSRAMTRKLVEKGWLALAWPREYGGQARSIMEQVVFGEETAYKGCPGIDFFGVKLAGPTVIVHGTEEQKRLHLPRIARGEVLWCQLFSEPEAGSDLASLRTRAVEDGDEFVINGQKVWTSGGHRADWGMLPARTDPQAPKHKGISYFLLDMKTPGVEVRPLVNLANGHSFNEVFFNDVRVPRSCMIGPKNQGWYVTADTLNFERSGVDRPAGSRRLLEGIIAFAKEFQRGGRPLSQDPIVRHMLAEAALELELNRLLCYRVAMLQSQGLIPSYEASISKLVGSELQLKVARMGVQVMGLYGQLEPGSKYAPLQGLVERLYLSHVGRTIAVGTSEIHRNLIATRGLGLPR